MAGIYIHIPICKSRCIYCDFYSTTDGGDGRQKELAEAIRQEIELRAGYLRGATVNTIYFGGGTPSVMRSEYVSSIIEAIRKNFQITTQPEITLEANPDDLHGDYLEELRAVGINRLSMGVQSFDDRILKFINRRHNARQALSAVENAHRAGFGNISIDLIYGFPEQSMEMWLHDLRTALSLRVQHVSAYGLTYEEGTRLHQMAAQGTITPATDEQMNSMYDLLTDTLQAAGYEPYEVSNFALPGFRSAHNSAYWNGTPYLGLGPAAHSFNGTSRQWNISSLTGYIAAMQRRETCFESEELSAANRYNECVMLGLRTAAGIDLQGLETQFGARQREYCLKQARQYVRSGCLTLENGRLAATRKGIKILNLITGDLLDA